MSNGKKYLEFWKFSEKNKAKHDEKSLRRNIIKYFEYCEENDLNLTMTGLSLYLGFQSLQSLFDYENKDEACSYIIKKARVVIEMSYEHQLTDGYNAGAIFALKNFKSIWKDKTEQEVKTTNVTLDLSGEDNIE